MKAMQPLADVEDHARLTHILESSLAVSNANQFFSWVQGPLFMMMPHEILICGHAALGSSDLKLRYFSATRYFRQDHFEIACNPRNGLIIQAISHWRTARSPCIVPSQGNTACDIATEDILHRLELKNMAAHGLVGSCGGIQSWFAFGRVKNLSERTAHLLELLMPIMSATYARVISMDAGAPMGAARVGRLLTVRETEVLEMVRDGMSNAEVAAHLALSVMTAKNHMQNIRGKLKVSTRGQAVAEAIRLGLIRHSRETV